MSPNVHVDQLKFDVDPGLIWCSENLAQHERKMQSDGWGDWFTVCQHATLKRQERKDMRKERRTALISNGRRIIDGVSTVSLKQRYVENGIL